MDYNVNEKFVSCYRAKITVKILFLSKKYAENGEKLTFFNQKNHDKSTIYVTVSSTNTWMLCICHSRHCNTPNVHFFNTGASHNTFQTGCNVLPYTQFWRQSAWRQWRHIHFVTSCHISMQLHIYAMLQLLSMNVAWNVARLESRNKSYNRAIEYSRLRVTTQYCNYTYRLRCNCYQWMSHVM